jgi:hypothetical protein
MRHKSNTINLPSRSTSNGKGAGEILPNMALRSISASSRSGRANAKAAVCRQKYSP